MFEHDDRLTPALVREWREAVQKYAARPDVLGVAIGYRWRRGMRTKKLCVRIHVATKIPPRKLGKKDLLPKARRGVCVDVVDGNLPRQMGTCATYARRTSRVDPVQPGYSFGPEGGESGTVGAFVVGSDGRNYVLSARHVLFEDGARNGDPVLQPGRPDGGRYPDDLVGELARYTRDYDAALMLCGDGRRRDPVPFEGPTFTGTRLPVVGDILEKSGRATCVTRAYVDAVGTYYGYKASFHLRAIDAEPKAIISEGGDSGAVWYDPTTGEAVGLHLRGDGLPGGNALATVLAPSPTAAGALAALKVRLA